MGQWQGDLVGEAPLVRALRGVGGYVIDVNALKVVPCPCAHAGCDKASVEGLTHYHVDCYHADCLTSLTLEDAQRVVQALRALAAMESQGLFFADASPGE